MSIAVPAGRIRFASGFGSRWAGDGASGCVGILLASGFGRNWYGAGAAGGFGVFFGSVEGFDVEPSVAPCRYADADAAAAVARWLLLAAAAVTFSAAFSSLALWRCTAALVALLLAGSTIGWNAGPRDGETRP